MKQTIVRIIIFFLFVLVFYALSGDEKHDAILKAFVVTYILEPAVMYFLNK